MKMSAFFMVVFPSLTRQDLADADNRTLIEEIGSPVNAGAGSRMALRLRVSGLRLNACGVCGAKG